MKTLSFPAPDWLPCWPPMAATLMLLGTAVSNLLPGSAWAVSKPVLASFAERTTQAPAIKELVSNCILEPGSFGGCKPGRVFTRGEFAAEARRVFRLTKPSKEFFFADVPSDSPIYAAVQSVAPFMPRRILCPGCALTSIFSPDTPISRAELAVAVVQVLTFDNKVTLLSPAEAQRVLAAFPDTANVPAVARLYLATAVKSGIIGQFPARKLEPAATYNRAEGAGVLEYVQLRYGFLQDDDRDRD